MKRLQVLGTGCPKCQELTRRTETAAQDAGLDYELEKVTDLDEIVQFGVMMTPALVVDGQVKAMGNVPSVAEIRTLLA